MSMHLLQKKYGLSNYRKRAHSTFNFLKEIPPKTPPV